MTGVQTCALPILPICVVGKLCVKICYLCVFCHFNSPFLLLINSFFVCISVQFCTSPKQIITELRSAYPLLIFSTQHHCYTLLFYSVLRLYVSLPCPTSPMRYISLQHIALLHFLLRCPVCHIRYVSVLSRNRYSGGKTNRYHCPVQNVSISLFYNTNPVLLLLLGCCM